MRKRSGGIVLLLAAAVWGFLERWSVLDPVLRKLRESGPIGVALARYVLSPVLPLVIALVGFSLMLSRETENDSSRTGDGVKDSFNPNFQNSPTTTINNVIRLDQQESSIREPDQQDLPRLEFSDFELATITNKEGYQWNRIGGVPEAYAAIIARFRNRPQPLGQQTAVARGVVANMVFNSNGRDQHIEFGTWLGEYTREVVFTAGGVQHLIIAVRDGGDLFTLNNPKATDPREQRFRSSRGLELRLPECIPLEGLPSSVEITLISRNLTVFQRVFKINLSAGLPLD